MKKLLILFSMLVSSLSGFAQCEIPLPFSGNTGSNMTVMLTPDFINSLSISSDDAYIVALSSDAMVIGSVSVSGLSQTSLAVWGDDTDTPATDGALFGEAISLQLVDGSSLYDLTPPVAISYSTNAMSVQSAAAAATLCESEVQSGGCDYPTFYDGNTGNNMTLMLTPGFFAGVTVTSETAYISATSGGMLVGSVNAYGIDQTSLAVWGDDSSTDEVDGAALGALITLELVDGDNLFILNTVDIPYVVNGTQVIMSGSATLTCGVVEIFGCTDPSADNFLISANTDDGSCEYTGCTDASADNYDASANVDNGSCSWSGCTNVAACNYDAIANDDDGSCFFNEPGYDCNGVCLNDADGDGICDEFEVVGCMDENACNYNASATDPANCTYPIQEWLDCDGDCNLDSDNDGICDEFEQSGCTNPTAFNYNENATDDDGSCQDVILGCINPIAANYDSAANTDNGLCQINGCTDDEAFNYNPDANFNDGSCQDVIGGCLDPLAANYNPDANTDNFSCAEVVIGCTDPGAINFDPLANTDGGGDIDFTQVEVSIYPEGSDGSVEVTAESITISGMDEGSADGSGSIPEMSNMVASIVISTSGDYSFNWNHEDQDLDGAYYAVNVDPSSTFSIYGSNPQDLPAGVTVLAGGSTGGGIGEGVVSLNAGDVLSFGVAGEDLCCGIGTLTISALSGGSACEYVSFNGAWPSDPNGLDVTGNNSTIAISGDLDLDSGDLVGAFYEANNEIVCGGLLIWDADATDQLIIVWGDDANAEGQNGFDAGDQIVWMAYDQSTGENINLYPEYSIGNNSYMVNAAYVISGWIVDPVYGCMDLAYQNYDSSALVDDGTCAVLWSDVYADQAVLLSDALSEIDELDDEVLSLENQLATTISSYQGQLQDMSLDYEGQLFDQYSWLTDSLNNIHNQWNVAVDNLVADSLALEAYIDALQADNTSLEAYVDELQADSTYLEATIAGLEGDVDGLEQHVASLLSDSLALEIHVYNLQADSTAFEATIAGLLNDVSGLESDVDGLEADVAGLESDLAQTIDDYNNEIVGLNNSHDAYVVALNTAHDGVVEGLEQDAANAANAAADLLAQTIESYQLDSANTVFNYESQISNLTSDYENQIDVLNSLDAAEDYNYESIISGLQSDSTLFEAHIANLQSDSTVFELVIDGLDADIVDLNNQNTFLSSEVAYYSAPIVVDLAQGWNMIGFGLQEPMDVAASLEELGDNIHLIKNNNAAVYWPEFGFNSLGTLVPGQGYQIRMYGVYEDYTFPYIPGERLEVTPQVPTWVEDLVVPSHPNDTRSLVRVVNMLGQEVVPEDVFTGEVLLYLYSDGSVEKSIM